jgi:hypothetical protein
LNETHILKNVDKCGAERAAKVEVSSVDCWYADITVAAGSACGVLPQCSI